MSKNETNAPIVDENNPEDVKAALALLRRTKEQQAKQREKIKNDPEAKAKASAAAKLRRLRDKVVLRKAAEQGITATEEEIQAELDA